MQVPSTFRVGVHERGLHRLHPYFVPLKTYGTACIHMNFASSKLSVTISRFGTTRPAGVCGVSQTNAPHLQCTCVYPQCLHSLGRPLTYPLPNGYSRFGNESLGDCVGMRRDLKGVNRESMSRPRPRSIVRFRRDSFESNLGMFHIPLSLKLR
jgi:hypothetical protein